MAVSKRRGLWAGWQTLSPPPQQSCANAWPTQEPGLYCDLALRVGGRLCVPDPDPPAQVLGDGRAHICEGGAAGSRELHWPIRLYL